ncbi:MAG: formate dehydrogenase accessory sulfurtransferase FdhD [Kofleriaceae bacterium]
MSSPIKRVSIERVDVCGPALEAARTSREDPVAVEAPLVVRARGERVLTLMRTPGHDLELTAGLLHAEALPRAAIRAATDAHGRPLAHEVDVDLDPSRFAARALTSVAACGVCGRQTIADLEQVARAVDSDLAVPAAVVTRLPAALRATQAVFDETGGLHAAALATPAGALLVAREDVGRHNAVDKVIGWALAAGVSAAELILVVSGRLGYEIVQKAVRFGVPLVVAVSAPSSLAVELAERFRISLCGFVREGHFNVYSHGWRIG